MHSSQVQTHMMFINSLKYHKITLWAVKTIVKTIKDQTHTICIKSQLHKSPTQSQFHQIRMICTSNHLWSNRKII